MNKDEIQAHAVLAKNGDTASFCRLYELYYKDMYRFAYYMLGNGQDAEDVISETVLDAFAGIGSLKHPSKFKAWIFQILTRKCKRQMAVYTDNRKHIQSDSMEELLTSSDYPYANSIDVQRAFSALNDTEKTIISLIVFGGYTSRETARILHSTEGTVRSAKSRAFSKMSQYLKEDFT